MHKITTHQIKVKRALAMSSVGKTPASAQAMIAAIPDAVIDNLPARLIAQLLDANMALARASKDIAIRDAINEGAVWDSSRQAMREIAQ